LSPIFPTAAGSFALFTKRCSRGSYAIEELRSNVTTRVPALPCKTVRETRVGAAEALTALAVNASRGGVFSVFQLAFVAAIALEETVPAFTGKIPLVRLIGSFPRTSSGCTGTKPSNPVLDRKKTPVTGRNGTNPLNPPKPKPGDHSHPSPGSNIHPP
jgi:hypothetical protein